MSLNLAIVSVLLDFSKLMGFTNCHPNLVSGHGYPLKMPCVNPRCPSAAPALAGLLSVYKWTFSSHKRNPTVYALYLTSVTRHSDTKYIHSFFPSIWLYLFSHELLLWRRLTLSWGKLTYLPLWDLAFSLRRGVGVKNNYWAMLWVHAWHFQIVRQAGAQLSGRNSCWVWSPG